MIVYSVHVTIHETVHAEWFEWMRQVHIPDVLRTGLFVSHAMYRLLSPVADPGISYVIQYFCQNIEEYERYRTEYAALLQAAHTEKFQGRFVASRMVMEEVGK